MESMQNELTLSGRKMPIARYLILELLSDEKNDDGRLYPRENEDVDVITFIISAIRSRAKPESVLRRVSEMGRAGLVEVVMGTKRSAGGGKVTNVGITDLGEEYLKRIKEYYPGRVEKLEIERLSVIDNETIKLRHGELNHMRSLMGKPPVSLRASMPIRDQAVYLSEMIERHTDVLDGTAKVA